MNIMAQDVLSSLFSAEDIVNLRAFDDKKDGVFSGAKLSEFTLTGTGKLVNKT